jgi:CubicO group peptidase (beta-lactamase class C family)
MLCTEKNKGITLENLLTMSTGLKWDEISYPYGHRKNTSQIASATGDEFKYLFSQPRSKEKKFSYNSLNHLLMNEVLAEATGMDNGTQMKLQLLDPLGITEYDLGESRNGILGDIFLRPRDMLKFGLLYLNNGNWNGKQIVPAAWVHESTSTKIQVNAELGYGYFWWTRNFEWKGRIIKSYFAWGYGGQYIFVVPDLKLVAVMMATNWTTDPTKYAMGMMQDYIIPACD